MWLFFFPYSVAKERRTSTSSSRARSPCWPLLTSWSSPTSTRASSPASPTWTLSSSIHPCTASYEKREQKIPPTPPPPPTYKKSMDCRRLQDSFQNSHGRPAVERLLPSSTVFCLLVNNDRVECSQVLKTACVGEEKVHGTDDFYYFIFIFIIFFCIISPKHLTICSWFYICVFFLRTCSLFSRVGMCESVTVSLGIKDANPLFSFSSYSRCPVLPRNKLQCTTRTEHIFPAPSRLYLLLNRYTCILYLHTFGKKKTKKKEVVYCYMSAKVEVEGKHFYSYKSL